MSAWQNIRRRYAALARRERGLVMAATLAGILAFGLLFLIEPAYKQRMQLARQQAQQQRDLDALRPQVASLQDRQRNPDAATLAQLKALTNQLQLTDAEFAQVQRSLVAPHEMGQLLESLLRSHSGLQLVGLRSVPVMSVTELMSGPASATAATPAVSSASQPAAGHAAKDAAWLYRHGVEVTVQGSYADMQAYLAALEKLPRRVYWGELRLDARQWPANLMTVTVYTISLEKTWWRV